MSSPREVGRTEVVWLLGSLCGFHRLPFDAALVGQAFPPPRTLATFHEAARSPGLKTGSVGVDSIDWAQLPLPAVGFLHAANVLPTGGLQ